MKNKNASNASSGTALNYEAKQRKSNLIADRKILVTPISVSSW